MKLIIKLWDITEETTDIIVNSASKTLLKWGWVCWKIHEKAWYWLIEECLRLRDSDRYKFWLKLWDVVITNSYNLKSKWIIHTLWPYCKEYIDNSWVNVLEKCYINCLKLTEEKLFKSISFPLIWNYTFWCDYKISSVIALKSIKKYFDEYKNSNINEVRIIVYNDIEKYNEYIKHYNNIFLNNI